MALPCPILKVNQVQTGGMVNISPFNVPVGTGSNNKVNRLGDNFGDLSLAPTICSILIDNDLFDYLSASTESDVIV